MIGDHCDGAPSVGQHVPEWLGCVVPEVQPRTMPTDHEESRPFTCLIQPMGCEPRRRRGRQVNPRPHKCLHQLGKVFDLASLECRAILLPEFVPSKVDGPLGLEHRRITGGVQQLDADRAGAGQVSTPTHGRSRCITVPDADDHVATVEARRAAGWDDDDRTIGVPQQLVRRVAQTFRQTADPVVTSDDDRVGVVSDRYCIERNCCRVFADGSLQLTDGKGCISSPDGGEVAFDCISKADRAASDYVDDTFSPGVDGDNSVDPTFGSDNVSCPLQCGSRGCGSVNANDQVSHDPIVREVPQHQ
jgi:hypothetical protein